MPVTSLLTSLQDFESAPTFVSNSGRYGGGQGAAQNNDIVRAGSFSGGRRADNAFPGGLGAVLSSTNLSSSSAHLKAWVSITQWSALNALNIIIASGNNANAGDVHSVPQSNWPENFGFIPVWIHTTRTPESGGPANKAAINECGVQVDIGDVGGNAQNVILDEIHFGDSGLRWTGTGGSFTDFRNYEQINNIGVYLTINSVDFCYYRIEINDDFTDNDFSITYPDQPLVAIDGMGLSIDLSVGTGSVDLSGGEIKSSNSSLATRRPDLIVNGTTRTLQVCSAIGARLIQLTSSCTCEGQTLDGLELTQGGATITNSTIQTRTTAGVALIDDANLTLITNSTFRQFGTGHAIELQEGVGNVSLTGLTFIGYGANGTNNSAINYTGATPITLAFSGGTEPTVTGNITVLQNQITATITGQITGGFMVIYDDDSADPQELGTELQRFNSVSATETYTYSESKAGDDIVIHHYASGFKQKVETVTLLANDFPIDMTPDVETN